jgi:tellurite resistance protein
MFTDLLRKGKELMHGASDGVSNMMSSKFMESFIACSVAIAGCDGDFDDNERNKIRNFVAADKSLSRFDKEDIEATISRYSSADNDVCQISALKLVNKIRGLNEREFLMRTLVSLARADGNVDEKEMAFIKAVAVEVELDYKKYTA